MIVDIIPEIKTAFGSGIFSYEVPKELSKNIIIGVVVEIPFGKKRVRGVVVKIQNASLLSASKHGKSQNDNSKFKIKPIISISDIILPKEYILISQWISKYYLSSLGDAISLFLPTKIRFPRNKKDNEKPKIITSKLNRLTFSQKSIFDKIAKNIPSDENKKPALIYGVTGSGKTEIYLHLAKKTLEIGKSVIFLVPEIILTPQSIERFEEIFAGQVCIMHSNLSNSERFLCYQQFLSGEKKIIIGPRSALLVPNKNTGLIIIDEEQEESYKQEQNPRYETLALAEKIVEKIKAQLVVGSATPRIETFYKASKSIYDIYQLSGRYNALTLPTAEIIDLRQEIKKGNYSPFSERLQEAISNILKNKEQAILFLNRRGSATFVSCRDCGYVATCKNCEVPLVYHFNDSQNYLVCHHCDRKYQYISHCPNCGSAKIKYFGTGVEKIETEICKLFPKARIKRVDAKVLRNHKKYEEFYQDFKNHKFDIVIGTQILAKGFDIPDVSLVGIISADVGLHLPYFRAIEKIFRLIVQVSGRSGRRDKPGRTIIQTYWPNSVAIRFAAKHDFEGFYQSEIKKRLKKNYPPASHIIRVLSEHRNEIIAREKINQLVEELKNYQIDFIGPGPCFFHRLHNKFRYQIIIKIKKLSDKNISILFSKFSRLVWDVDAQDLL